MKPFPLLLAACAVSLVSVDAQTLKLTQTIPLHDVEGRFDHFALDPRSYHLFVAALGNNTVEVIDVEKFARVHSIRNLRKPTGLAVVADVGKVYVANGDDGTFRVFDARTFSSVARLASLDDADNVRFDRDGRRLYVGFGDGALGVTDETAGQLLGRVELKGHPESFQIEREGPRIFVNVPDAKMIAVVDREKRAVVAQWPMEKFQANFPMALDEETHRLFIGCRRPARLVIFDTVVGKPISDLEISGDTDDLFFDSQRQRLYVSCGEGFVDVIQRREVDRYERIERVRTRAGARTSFWSADLSQLYVAVPQRGGQDAELRIYEPN